MHTIVAEWGYITEHEDPEDWGAQTHVKEPTELLKVLGTGAGRLNPEISARGVPGFRLISPVKHV